MTYAFYFDSTSCSGCKACQVACKDKNKLPLGVLWRRVYEVSGGTWHNVGVGSPDTVWNNTVFAYNLSISCNHCVHPKCAGVCPVKAYRVHDNGIVILDTTKCVGCGYCSWACPYGAPQYHPDAGHMTKCDFCYDNLEQGLPPACVAACPMRVLDYGDTGMEQGLATNRLALWSAPAETHPYPLPNYSHTQPRLAIKLRAAMNVAEQKSVANAEEIKPRNPSAWEEVPLILFTLLGQLAVGGFWAMAWMFPPLWNLAAHNSTALRLIPSLLIGACLGLGMLASFAHLGTKKNAWRVLSHLRRSWLSREILSASLFGLGWLFTTLESVLYRRNTFEWTAMTAILGIGLVHSMAQVYRLPAAPGWNTWRTNAGFLISALLLGLSVMTPVLAYESNITGILISPVHRAVISSGTLILLLVQLAMTRGCAFGLSYQNIRIRLLLIGIALTVWGIIRPSDGLLFNTLVFLIVASEEGLGRWIFYRCRL